jgi:hypothetical protein
MNWTRKPQEQDGAYMFSGQFYVTSSVNDKIPPEDIFNIYDDIQKSVAECGGVDYLQIYESDNGLKLYFIDQLSKEMVESRQFEDKENYCTLMLSSES